MISIVNYVFENIVLPNKIREGIALTKRTSYDTKSAQVKANNSYSGNVSYNPEARREALLRRTTMV